MSIELKPCHCGSDGPFLGVQHKEGFLSLVCPKCSRSVEAFTTEGLAEGWNEPTVSISSQSKAENEENQARLPTVDQVMEQAEIFASAWSLVGGPFDSGDQLKQAKREKEELLGMVAALAGEQSHPIQVQPEQATWGYAKTIGNLIAQLRTLDPSMPIYAPLRLADGRVSLKGLTLSKEWKLGRFIQKGAGSERVAVLWTKPDDRPAQVESRIVLNDLLLQAASMLSNPSASMTARQQLTRNIEGELENNPLLQVEREEVSHG